MIHNRSAAAQYIVHRVLVRIEEQAILAFQYGRTNDAAELSRLIGRLEYLNFGACGFEQDLEYARS